MRSDSTNILVIWAFVEFVEKGGFFCKFPKLDAQERELFSGDFLFCHIPFVFTLGVA